GESAARIQCHNNLKQITLAIVNCADTNSGLLPPGLGLYPNRVGTERNGEGGLFLHILPYIEQDNLYNASLVLAAAGGDGRNTDANGVTPHSTYTQWNATIQGAHVKVYFCPADPTQDGGWAKSNTSYAYNGM